jgi:hypothetical protein
VTLHSGPKAPCPCLVDGVMVVTAASPGQGTLRVAAGPAAVSDPPGQTPFVHLADPAAPSTSRLVPWCQTRRVLTPMPPAPSAPHGRSDTAARPPNRGGCARS